MSSSRLRKSLSLRDSIVTGSKSPHSSGTIATSNEDQIFMHILDCIGALSCIRAVQKKKADTNMEESASAALLASKHRVFWQAVREVADLEAALEDIAPETIKKSIQKEGSLDYVLKCFPDDAKGSDGRMWLPLHWAVTLPPAIQLSDLHTIFTSDPAAIKAHCDETRKFNPCHLAAMMKNPRLEIIRRLQIYYPLLGSSLDSQSRTPLHLAAMSSNSVAMVRELAQLYPAALEMKNTYRKTPLHLAVIYSDSVEIVRELAQLHPAALEIKNDRGDTPLNMAVEFSYSVEIVRELVSLSPAALVSMNASDETPLAMITSSYHDFSEVHGKLQVLLEAAPQAAGIACSSGGNKLPLHQILENSSRRLVTPEMVAMLLAAYKDAVNIPDVGGWLPVHFAAWCAPVDILKMIAEENMSNLSVILPICGSAAHLAVNRRRFDNLRYIHAMMPELLLSVDDSKMTPLHDLIHENDFDESLEELSRPLSAASDVLRFLLRHCPSLACARDSFGGTLYSRLPAELVYARRLLLLAGASSLYPGVLQKMNYAARRAALLLFYSSATKPSIFFRIRHAAGGPVLIREIIGFL